MEVRRCGDFLDDHPIRIRVGNIEHGLTLVEAKRMRDRLSETIRETIELQSLFTTEKIALLEETAPESDELISRRNQLRRAEGLPVRG